MTDAWLGFWFWLVAIVAAAWYAEVYGWLPHGAIVFVTAVIMFLLQALDRVG